MFDKIKVYNLFKIIIKTLEKTFLPN